MGRGPKAERRPLIVEAASCLPGDRTPALTKPERRIETPVCRACDPVSRTEEHPPHEPATFYPIVALESSSRKGQLSLPVLGG